MSRKLAAIAAFIAVAGWVFTAEPVPPEVKKYEAKPGTVTFHHAEHVKSGLKCVACHHMTKEGQAPQPCSTCHNAQATEKTPKLFQAIHGTADFSCTGCHTKNSAAGKKTGPIQRECKSCHVK